MENLTYAQLCTQTAQQLAFPDRPTLNHEQEASWLIKHVAGAAPSVELAQLNPDQLQLLSELVNRRVMLQEPLAYILGNAPFCGLEIAVRSPILIPRLETEEWCAELILRLKPLADKPLTIVDLCSGSGCISLALAKTMPASQVIGVDINPEAIALAQQNARQLGLLNVKFVQGDLFHLVELPAEIDLIVSNPPYVSSLEWEQLAVGVKTWEDPRALVAAEDGLKFYPQIAKLAAQRLSKILGLGWCVVEIGHLQGNAVSRVFTEQNLEVQQIWRDSFGKDRAVFMAKK